MFEIMPARAMCCQLFILQKCLDRQITVALLSGHTAPRRKQGATEMSATTFDQLSNGNHRTVYSAQCCAETIEARNGQAPGSWVVCYTRSKANGYFPCLATAVLESYRIVKMKS
jgi:hypothetical protein